MRANRKASWSSRARRASSGRTVFFLGDGANGVLAYAPQHLEWTINRNSVYNPHAGKNEEMPHAEVLKRVEAMEWKNVDFLQEDDRIVIPRGDQSTVTPVQLRLRFWPDLAWSAPAAPSIDGMLEMGRGRLVETVVGSRLDRSIETVVPRTASRCRPVRSRAFGSASPTSGRTYGLSYTTFAYAKPTAAKATFRVGEPVTVAVRVRNTGSCAGREIVQLYVRDESASVLPRERELKEYASVWLEPGEEKKVVFTLRDDAFALYDQNLKRVVEPGDFTVFIGGDSTTTNGVKVVLRSGLTHQNAIPLADAS